MSRLNDHIEVPTRKPNRLSARSPRGGLYWCWCCDRNIIGEGERCDVCGFRKKKTAKISDLT